MVANIRGYTPNYSFKLVNFDTPRWHTLEYSNWMQVDALLKQAYIPYIKGEWLNTTLYINGDRVIDPNTQLLYRCQVDHTSSPAPATFAQDRATYPTYWMEQIPGVPIYRGPWAAGALYAQGDIAQVDSYAYYLCNIPHTSSSSFPPDAAKWTMVFDGTDVVNDAEAAVALAEASAIAAAASATSASNFADAASDHAVDAQESEETAIAAAEAATSAQGAFRWNFDDSTTASDPGMGNFRLNAGTMGGATAIILSAQTGDVGNPDISDWITTWDDSTNVATRGTIYIRKNLAPQNFAVFSLTGSVADSGTWLQIGVTPIVANGYIFDDEACSVAFIRTGNQGASGVGSGDMIAANNLSDVDDPVAAADNIGVGPLDTPPHTQILLGSEPTLNNHAATKLYSDNASNNKVLKTGDSMSGDLYITKPSAILGIVSTTDTQAVLTFYNNSIRAWDVLTQTGARDLLFSRMDDAGTFVDVPMQINRATGHVILNKYPTSASHAATKQYVDDGDVAVSAGFGLKVSKSGDTMTGSLTISNAGPAFVLSKSGNPASASLFGYKDNNARWQIELGNGITETGGNVGSNFSLNRYDDAGTYTGTPLSIDRASGNVNFSGAVVGAGSIYSHANLHAGAIGASGAVIFGSNVSKYMNYDGSNFSIRGGSLYVDALIATGGVYGTGLSITGGSTITGSETISSNLSVNGAINATYLNMYSVGAISQANGGYNQITAPVGNQPFITFHQSGAFACNFGMDAAGNFFMGGWSHGATAHKFWTTRDFASLPSQGVQNARLAYVGDYGHSLEPQITEPYAGSVQTGSYGYGANARYRAMQITWDGVNFGTIGYV